VSKHDIDSKKYKDYKTILEELSSVNQKYIQYKGDKSINKQFIKFEDFLKHKEKQGKGSITNTDNQNDVITLEVEEKKPGQEPKDDDGNPRREVEQKGSDVRFVNKGPRVTRSQTRWKRRQESGGQCDPSTLNFSKKKPKQTKKNKNKKIPNKKVSKK
jgi:hypothetical protein